MLKHVDWRILGVFVVGSLIGILMGGAAVVDLPPAMIQIGIGLFILWTVFFRPPGFLKHSAWLVGIVSSFLTMFFGATGPFVSAYLKSRGYDRMGQVAMQGACMTAQHVLKVVAFGVLGFAFAPYALLIVGLIVFGFAGTVVGKRVLTRIDEKRFRLALNTILMLLAARLVWTGTTGLL